MHILIVEDEIKAATLIRKSLEEYHYTAEIAYDGVTADNMLSQFDYDLVILDVVLPFMNGIDLCKKIKQTKPGICVLLLTALGTTDNKLAGFDAGADDYLVKPFEFSELLARIRALCRRNSAHSGRKNSLVIADLELDLDKKVAIRGGHEILLTLKEFELLEYFMRHTNYTLKRPDIEKEVWGVNFDTGTNVVDVYVNILRKKIDRDFPVKLIHTRFGIGYMFGEVLP